MDVEGFGLVLVDECEDLFDEGLSDLAAIPVGQARPIGRHLSAVEGPGLELVTLAGSPKTRLFSKNM